jgi:hypothetical protein
MAVCNCDGRSPSRLPQLEQKKALLRCHRTNRRKINTPTKPHREHVQGYSTYQYKKDPAAITMEKKHKSNTLKHTTCTPKDGRLGWRMYCEIQNRIGWISINRSYLRQKWCKMSWKTFMQIYCVLRLLWILGMYPLEYFRAYHFSQFQGTLTITYTLFHIQLVC